MLRLSSKGGVISTIRAMAVTLVLVAGVLLAGCTELKSSAPVVVGQGPANATPATPRSAESAILADLHGTVEVETGDGQWTLAQPGQTLRSGQQFRTGALSNVTLTFYDGSRMHLGADAEIALDALDARTSGARVVQLTQVSGESQHEVAESDDPGSHYDVNTPAGNGRANGATFTVMVVPGQLGQFWVETGAVSVENVNVTVGVAAGQTTVILVGEPPVEAEFRITGEGQVMQTGTAANGSVIPPASAPNAQENQIGKITLCHATGSATNPYVEITISVEGATNGHAKHPGDIIPAPADGCPVSTPTTSSTPTSWNIAGQTFLSGAGIITFGNPQPGDWVSFEGRLLADGSRFADRIVVLSHSPESQFTFIGKVESVADTAWTISSRVVQVNESTAIDAGLKVGDNVQVGGEIAQDGVFWAARLNRTEGDGSNFRFAGVLTGISNDLWTISGIKVTVDVNTKFYGDFVSGNPVTVEGVIKEDGTWLATEIKHTGLHLGQGCFWVSSVVQSIKGDQILLIDGQTLVRTQDLEVTGDLKEASLVRYQSCVDKDGVGKIGRIIVVYQFAELAPVTGKVVICHYPPGSPGSRHTIEVGQPAVSAHVAHGDTLGLCPSEELDKSPKKVK